MRENRCTLLSGSCMCAFDIGSDRCSCGAPRRRVEFCELDLTDEAAGSIATIMQLIDYAMSGADHGDAAASFENCRGGERP